MVFNMLMFACCLGVIDPFHLSRGSMLTTNQIWLLCSTTLPGSVLILCAYWALIRINLYEYPQGSRQQNVQFNPLINTKLAFVVIYMKGILHACCTIVSHVQLVIAVIYSLRQDLQTQNDARLHEQLGDCLAHVSQFQDALDHYHIALRFVPTGVRVSIHVCQVGVWAGCSSKRYYSGSQ